MKTKVNSYQYSVIGNSIQSKISTHLTDHGSLITSLKRRHSQVVRRRSAKPLFSGSNPDAASNNIPPFQKNYSVNDATPLQSLSFPQAIRKY